MLLGFWSVERLVLRKVSWGRMSIAGISLAAGEGLVEDIGNGEDPAVHLYINSQTKNRTTYNVIAQTKGGDPDNVVSLGGHTDSVEAGPGINDDGSGIISNLVIAKAQLQHLFQNYFTSRNLSFVATEFDSRSDYAAFIDHGIPAGGLFTGAETLKTEAEADVFGGQARSPYDAHYHKAGDTINHLNHEAFLLSSQATAFAVATYANSLASIPPRGNIQTRRTTTRREPVKHAHGLGSRVGMFPFTGLVLK